MLLLATASCLLKPLPAIKKSDVINFCEFYSPVPYTQTEIDALTDESYYATTKNEVLYLEICLEK